MINMQCQSNFERTSNLRVEPRYRRKIMIGRWRRADEGEVGKEGRKEKDAGEVEKEERGGIRPYRR